MSNKSSLSRELKLNYYPNILPFFYAKPTYKKIKDMGLPDEVEDNFHFTLQTKKFSKTASMIFLLSFGKTGKYWPG